MAAYISLPDKVLVIGGYYGSDVFTDTIAAFDGTWSLYGKLQHPRAYHNAILSNNKIYIIGGGRSEDK